MHHIVMPPHWQRTAAHAQVLNYHIRWLVLFMCDNCINRDLPDDDPDLLLHISEQMV